MATSGTLNSGNYQGRYVQFKWTATQDITNNKSTISWTLKGAGTGQSSWYKAGAFKVVIDGSTVYSTSESDRITLYDGTSIASGEKVITHTSDGSRKFKVRIEAGIYTYAVNCTGETEFTLTTIPRASTFKVSDDSVDMGTAVTFTITRASTAFTHKLTLTWGDKVSNIATGVATSQAWTPPLTLANDLPNSTSSGCTITCITYNGSTEIGRKTLPMTLTVPSSVKPSISSVTLSEAVSGLASKFGAYIQNKSKLKVVTAASGSYSSTIKSYSTKILNKTYTGSTITSGLLTSSGSVSVAVTVTDSRGRTATKTEKVTVTAYSDPKITTFTAKRCNSDGTLNDDGEYVELAIAFSVTSANSKNSKSYTVGYKLKDDADFTTLTSGSVYSLNTTYIPTVTFSGDNSYDFILTVTDYFKPVSQIADIQTAFTLTDYHSSGTGMAIGKVSEKENTLEIALDAEFNKTLRAKKGIFIEDTRDVNLTPDEYRAMGRGVYYEFKRCETVLLSDTSHTYCTIETFVQWKDTSGGSVKQILFDNDRVWYRYGDTVWSSWKPILYRMAWQSVNNGVSYKIQDGMCTVRGNSNTTLAISKSGVVACTLPEYARPTVEIFGTLTTKANVCGQISIGTDGKVTLWTFGSDTTYWAFTVNYPID